MVHAKNALYDSYVRSIRWASDRIGTSGIIALVTNASFLKSETAQGIRASLEKEFDYIWCYDLRGNQRTQGEIFLCTSKRREVIKSFEILFLMYEFKIFVSLFMIKSIYVSTGI